MGRRILTAREQHEMLSPWLEAARDDLSSVINEYRSGVGNLLDDPDCAAGECINHAPQFASLARSRGLDAHHMEFYWPRKDSFPDVARAHRRDSDYEDGPGADYWDANHQVSVINHHGEPHVVDWTARQLDPSASVPHIEPLSSYSQKFYEVSGPMWQRHAMLFPWRLASGEGPKSWYHASPHDLPEGTVLIPGGGESPWGGSMGDETLHDHVWISPDESDAHYWKDAIREETGKGHVYEVEPENARLYQEHDPDGYHVSDRAVIKRRLGMPWRTEHPDYQPADVAHNYNPDIGGAQGGGGHKNYLVGPANNVWWHGSGSGDIGGGDADFGLHVGDYQTAADNLNARLGLNPNHPQGRWTGQHSLAEAHPGSYDENGNSVPNHMGYHRFTHSDGSPMHGSYRPNVFPLAIVGPMGNTIDTAVSDGQAHALIRRQRTRPPKTPKGYYYINAGEGDGVSPETGIVSAVSAAVPSVSHIQKLDPTEHEHVAQEAHNNWYDQKYNNPDKGSYDMSKVDGMPPTSMERYQELQRQRKEQENGALEWRRRRRGN
jgi:hypothetical protein